MKYPLHRIVQGVIFMCRYHQLWGGVLIAFGIGVLTGIWLESNILCYFFSTAMVLIGLCVMKK